MVHLLVQERQTALHIASRLGNVDNVVLLLQHGASPDAVTHDQRCVLDDKSLVSKIIEDRPGQT